MDSEVTFKVYYLDEIRRFSLRGRGSYEMSVGYEQLAQRIQAVFSIQPTVQLRLRWLDSDGDRIAFSSTEELRDAVHHLEAVRQDPGAALRIYATVKTDGSQPGQEGFDAGAIAHPGVYCDGCNSGIRGYRFKCLACPDYDLCLACLNRDVHNQHPMTLIRRPGDQQVGWGGGWGGHHHMMRRCFFRQQQQQQSETQASGCSSGDSAEADVRCRRQKVPRCPMRDSAAFCPAAATVTSGASAAPQTANANVDVGTDQLIEHVTSAINTFLAPLGIDASIQVMRQEADASVQAQPQASAEAAIKMTPLTEAVKQTASTQVRVGSSTASTQVSVGNGQTESSSVAFRQELENSEAAFACGGGISAGNSGGSESDGGGGYEIVGATPAAADVTAGAIDPKIARALEHMSAMGFNDEGGWLSRLLTAKDGDICAVLDAIRPIK